jgi:hypothetical protein
MIGAIFGVDAIMLLFGLAGLVIPLWAIVDAASRPSGAFMAAGSSKSLWISLILITWLLTVIIGFVLAVAYLASIRPRVRSAIG